MLEMLRVGSRSDVLVGNLLVLEMLGVAGRSGVLVGTLVSETLMGRDSRFDA